MAKALGQLLAGILVLGAVASSGADESARRPFASQALLTTVAAVANVAPVVSTIYAPQCLPGYVLCKTLFAGVSVIAATGHLALSGGADLPQTRALLHRGFGGDWVITPSHIAGEMTPQPLPEPPPPVHEGEGGWEPPPL